MNAQTTFTMRGDCLTPTSNAMLAKPLEFIHEDHLRERQICALLDTIAAGDMPEQTDLWDVLHFLTRELPLHLKDEEDDLFPLLRRRCEQEDEISNVIARLLSDHAHAAIDTPDVIATLNRLVAEPRAPDDEERRRLADFASHSRRHLILENAIILPFARHRLTPHDLRSLYLRMCQRRGLDRLGGPQHAE